MLFCQPLLQETCSIQATHTTYQGRLYFIAYIITSTNELRLMVNFIVHLTHIICQDPRSFIVLIIAFVNGPHSKASSSIYHTLIGFRDAHHF